MPNASSFRELIENALCDSGLGHVEVRMNHNRVRVLSIRGARRSPRVNVSSRLSGLGSQGISYIVGFVKGDRSAGKALQEALAGLPPAPAPRRRFMRLEHEGQVYHLGDILSEASRGLAGQGRLPEITWGRRIKIRRGQRSIRLGCYDPRRRLIRIHRILDDSRVPRWLIEYVVWHELLHDKHQVAENGRWHSPSFKREEASHEHYEQAQIWLREELPGLMRAASLLEMPASSGG